MTIGVIAILAALLLPVLSRAKEKARAVFCLNNERQITLGYRAQREDDLTSFDFSQEEGLSPHWVCPSAPGRVQPQPAGSVEAAWSGAWGTMSGHSMRVSSYAINMSWLAFASWHLGFMDLTDGQIDRQELRPVVADGVWWGAWPSATDLAPTDLYTGFTDPNPSGRGNGMGVMCIPRHGNRPLVVSRNWPRSRPMPGAVNVGFFDGHAAPVKLDDLWQLYWDPKYVPPNKRPGLP